MGLVDIDSVSDLLEDAGNQDVHEYISGNENSKKRRSSSRQGTLKKDGQAVIVTVT